jgi:hypothetical protein
VIVLMKYVLRIAFLSLAELLLTGARQARYTFCSGLFIGRGGSGNEDNESATTSCIEELT